MDHLRFVARNVLGVVAYLRRTSHAQGCTSAGTDLALLSFSGSGRKKPAATPTATPGDGPIERQSSRPDAATDPRASAAGGSGRADHGWLPVRSASGDRPRVPARWQQQQPHALA